MPHLVSRNLVAATRPPLGRGARGIVRATLLVITVGAATGCAFLRSSEEPGPLSDTTPTLDTRTRLEETWGPGEWAALLTGTFSSKDRNLAINIPTASWYVRDRERNGKAILGGLLAYDMITVENEDSRPRWRKLTSLGLLGVAGNISRESVDGTGEYRKSHWFFPFYRYHNVNGERIVYPLMIFPWALRSDAHSLPPPPAPTRIHSYPIDPEPVRTNPEIQPGWINVDPPPLTQRPASPFRGVDSSEPEFAEPLAVPSSSTLEPEPTRSPNRAEGVIRPRSETADVRSAANPNRAAPPTSPSVVPPPRKYVVQKGDTLYGLARRFYGSGNDWKRIRDANESVLQGREQLKVGATLVIPERR
ncbi:MAG: LysM peptidoglycan-binding domain-containing protein [Planctomycetota bacterium]